MSMVTRFELSPKQEYTLKRWKSHMFSFAKSKRIPEGLIPLFCNEMVYKWMIESNLIGEEFQFLCHFFPLTNWESYVTHSLKVACLLCVHVTYHSFQSALFRVSQEDFMTEFLQAHDRDRTVYAKSLHDIDMLTRDLYEGESYRGRKISEFFVNFIQRNSEFALHVAQEMESAE